MEKGNLAPFCKKVCWQLRNRKALHINGVKDQQGRVMAAIGILRTRQTHTLILSGFDQAIIQRGANESLIYHCIQDAKEQADFFDFEGSMLPEIEAFYRKFGGVYTPYLNIYKISTRQFLLEKLRFWYRRFRG